MCSGIINFSHALEGPQEIAKELDRSKEMLISAQILSPFGYFQVQDSTGAYVPAKVIKGGRLEPVPDKIIPSGNQILDLFRARIKSFLVNDKGEELTFQQAGINEVQYLSEYRKTGYYNQPNKLVYKIFKNPTPDQVQEGKEAAIPAIKMHEPQNGVTEGSPGEGSPGRGNAPLGKKDLAGTAEIEGYVFPINGMGLWDAIYGFLAIKTDGDTVIGISWYDQKETPGLVPIFQIRLGRCSFRASLFSRKAATERVILILLN